MVLSSPVPRDPAVPPAVSATPHTSVPTPLPCPQRATVQVAALCPTWLRPLSSSS